MFLVNGEDVALQLRDKSFVIIEETVGVFECYALFVVDVVEEVVGKV